MSDRDTKPGTLVDLPVRIDCDAHRTRWRLPERWQGYADAAVRAAKRVRRRRTMRRRARRGWR